MSTAPQTQGHRPMAPGTVLSDVMRARGLRKQAATAVMHCSDRMLYNFMVRKYAVPALKLAALCDLLDMDDDELIDDDGFLRRSEDAL